MKRSVLKTTRSEHSISNFKKLVVVLTLAVLSLTSIAQTVTIAPAGTPARPNLIPVNNTVSFSIDPTVFGACMSNLSYSWTLVNSENQTIYTSTSTSPKYNFSKEDVYTINVTVKTMPGGHCPANIIRSASSTIKVAKEGGPGEAPKPNMFSADALGTTISAYAMDDKGQVLSGPYDYFDPFPSDNAITAALSMDDKGNFFYLPTFLSGSYPLAMHGAVEVWAVDKNADHAPAVIARFDMNGSSTAELGLFRMGLDQKGNAWMLAGDGRSMYVSSFKTDGTKPVKASDIKTYTVPFESGSANDFESGDLAFDNKGNMYVLAGSSRGIYIYTMSTNSPAPSLSKKWRVTDAAGKNFGLAVTGTVFDAKGNMYFSALDGIYFIDYSAVRATAVVKKISHNFGLMDLATSQFPAAWTPPVNEGGTLPVKLMQFTATAANGKVKLNWSVASNETGSRFEVEKSYDGNSFRTLALVFNTERQGQEAYSFSDAVPLTGKAYYRLKMVDKEGPVTYSNIVFFKAQTEPSSQITLLQNPVRTALSFTYTAAENTMGQIAVYSYTGVNFFSQKHNLQKGNNSITLPLSSTLPAGIYLLEIKEGNSRQTVRFIRE